MLKAIRWAAVIAAGVLAGCGDMAARSRPPAVERITIHDHWMGMRDGAPFDGSWTIEREHDGYRLRGQATAPALERAASGKGARRTIGPIDISVPDEAVDALRDAMLAPPDDHVDPASLGVDMAAVQAWLDAEADKLNKQLSDPAQQARVAGWRLGMRDPSAVGKAIAYGLKTDFHSDDYPRLSIDLVLSDGSRWVAQSTSQNAMMLPWTDVSHAAHYTVALPDALEKILPAESPNAGRLTREGLSEDMEFILESGTKPQTGRMIAEAMVPRAVQALDGRFVVREIRAIEPQRFVKVVVADLGYAGVPSNVHMLLDTTLDRDDSILPWVMVDAERQWKAIGAAPELLKAIHAAPNDMFFVELSARTDMSSLGFASPMVADDTRKQFIRDMHARHELLDMSVESPLLARTVEVNQLPSGAVWMILPDHRVVQWTSGTED
jgi:hypothetical protein